MGCQQPRGCFSYGGVAMSTTTTGQRASKIRRYVYVFLVPILGLAFVLIAPSPAAHASEVSLVANFRLLGEVRCSGLGVGHMEVHLSWGQPQYQDPGLGNTLVGSLDIPPDCGALQATGVLSGLNGAAMDGSFHVVDVRFSKTFTINIGDNESQTTASLYAALGDTNGYSGAQFDADLDFSDNIVYAGSVLGSTRDQGLTLESVTVPGYEFAFDPAHTQLTAMASNWDAIPPYGVTYNYAVPYPDPSTRAAVFPLGRRPPRRSKAVLMWAASRRRHLSISTLPRRLVEVPGMSALRRSATIGIQRVNFTLM